MTRAVGKLFEIKKLRPAVSFPKRMNVIQIPHYTPGLFDKIPPTHIAQEIGLFKPPMYVRHTRFNVLAKLKLLLTLGKFDRANLACPRIDVLEQMPVDCLEVMEVEIPRWASFRRALDDERALDPVEFGRIHDAELVSQNRRARIKIGIVRVHSAANGRALARM